MTTIDELRAAGVTMLEMSFVDNAGITRVKAVPLGRVEAAVAHGVGASPCFETFGSDDVMVAGEYLGGPDGDLRLVPALDRAVPLSAMPGWAWAPANKHDQARQAVRRLPAGVRATAGGGRARARGSRC